jgi:hypothetical protein
MRDPLAPRCRPALLAALAASLLVVAPATAAGAPPASAAAKSKTLRDKKTGFRIKAPKGAKLKHVKGVYVVTRKGARFAIAAVATAQSPAAAGAEIARALGANVTSVKSPKSSYLATLAPRKGGAATAVAIRRRGKRLIVGRTTGKAGASGGPRATAALTTGEIAVLRRLVNSAAGGTPIALGSGIPLRRFTAADGSATAFVPDRPGWNYSGARGGIDGSNPNEGALAFGIAVPILTPGSFGSGTGQFVESPFVDAATAVRNVLPAWFARIGATVQVTGLTPFQGADQVLGANYNSGFFAATLNVGGAPFDGVILMGTAPIDGQYWLMYYSLAIVRRGADARIGPALLESWASWNPSADQQRRRNETLNTILTTQVAGGPIDQAVFDEAAAKWSAYIRE